MGKGICSKTKKERALQIIRDLLNASEIADSIEFTVKIDRKSMPTISYKIDGFPLAAPFEIMEDGV